MSDYSKSAYAKSLGISTGELESKAKAAGFNTTEEYANSQGYSGSGMLPTNAAPSALKFQQGLEAPINESLNNLVMTMRSQQKPLDVYNQLESEAGLPGMRKTAATIREQIGNVEDTLKRVEPDVNATTGNSFVTEAQRQGIVAAKQKPLLQTLSELTTGLGRVSDSITASSADLSNKINLFMQGQQMDLEPLKLQYTSLVDQASRLTSAFSTDSQNQLQILMANWNRKNQLDDRQVEQAFTLLQSENSYKKELQKAAASAGAKISGNESTDQLLNIIGKTAAEQLQYERSQKAGTGSITFGNGTTPFKSTPWGIVQSSALQKPQQSSPAGTQVEYPKGSGIYWTADSNGGWK